MNKRKRINLLQEDSDGEDDILEVSIICYKFNVSTAMTIK